MVTLSLLFPAGLGEPANPNVTPLHIKPEWYFYPVFRWLKVTNLELGIIGPLIFILILYIWPFIDRFFEKSFPTDFISEYIAQTRAWFYVLHVMSVGVFESESFKNVITTGTIAGEDGRKMSKQFGNYTDPSVVLENYSADDLRYYFLSSALMNAQNINFSAFATRE